jgi:hypothetical protein
MHLGAVLNSFGDASRFSFAASTLTLSAANTSVKPTPKNATNRPDLLLLEDTLLSVLLAPPSSTFAPTAPYSECEFNNNIPSSSSRCKGAITNDARDNSRGAYLIAKIMFF